MQNLNVVGIMVQMDFLTKINETPVCISLCFNWLFVFSVLDKPDYVLKISEGAPKPGKCGGTYT